MSPPNAAIDIPNLLCCYADAIDAGDFEAAAHMFDHGHILAGSERIAGADAIEAMWRGLVKLYSDGTPRTRHLVSNITIDLADEGKSASCRSQWTVLQAADGFPLQPVATGRYHDRFAVIDGAWQFTERQYARLDLAGDSSAHTRVPLAETGR